MADKSRLGPELTEAEIDALVNNTYTLFQNGRHFNIFLFDCKLALLSSTQNSKEYFTLTEAKRAICNQTKEY